MRVYEVKKNKKEVVKALSGICSSNPNTRQYIQHIFYDAANKKLVATDGTVMLIVDSIGIVDGEENGFFDLMKDTLIEKECNEKFPNYERVIPADGKLENMRDIYHPLGSFKEISYAIMISMLTGHIFNVDRKPVAACFKLYAQFEQVAWSVDNALPIKITGKEFMLLLQPYRTDINNYFKPVYKESEEIV